MVLVLGEILFDVFPGARKLGGAPFNFAYHLKKMGVDVRFISRVGQDEMGDEILEFLMKNGFDTLDIQVDPHFSTGTVTVDMKPDGSHIFGIRENAAYDRVSWSNELEKICENGWDMFYTGTLIQRNANNMDLVRKVLKSKKPGASVFCDINLRPGCYTKDNVNNCLESADILKLNSEELQKIAGIQPDAVQEEFQTLVKRFMADCRVETLILTKGENGSQWFQEDRTIDSLPFERSLQIRDTVGAGDAYAAMSAAGLLSGLTPEQIIPLAQDFSGRICEQTGALPKDDAVYEGFRRRLLK